MNSSTVRKGACFASIATGLIYSIFFSVKEHVLQAYKHKAGNVPLGSGVLALRQIRYYQQKTFLLMRMAAFARYNV